MGSVKEYFSSFAEGFISCLKGMQVTGKEFVTPKITEKYPENRANMPVAPRFRAILTLKYDNEGNHKCIACGTCERVCPNQTIRLNTKMVDTLKGKKKKLVDYNYDLGSCTFCQLCVTNCPTDALEFSNDFEQAIGNVGFVERIATAGKARNVTHNDGTVSIDAPSAEFAIFVNIPKIAARKPIRTVRKEALDIMDAIGNDRLGRNGPCRAVVIKIMGNSCIYATRKNNSRTRTSR